jgi:hypothetical protein
MAVSKRRGGFVPRRVEVTGRTKCPVLTGGSTGCGLTEEMGVSMGAELVECGVSRLCVDCRPELDSGVGVLFNREAERPANERSSGIGGLGSAVTSSGPSDTEVEHSTFSASVFGSGRSSKFDLQQYGQTQSRDLKKLV